MPPKRVKKVTTLPINVIFSHLKVSNAPHPTLHDSSKYCTSIISHVILICHCCLQRIAVIVPTIIMQCNSLPNLFCLLKKYDQRSFAFATGPKQGKSMAVRRYTNGDGGTNNRIWWIHEYDSWRCRGVRLEDRQTDWCWEDIAKGRCYYFDPEC